MQVRVLSFGILKESLGSVPFVLDLPVGATVADLLARLGVQAPMVETLGIAVSVNAEYAERSHVLNESDEVGLLPPVSGGSGADSVGQTTVVRLAREPIAADALVTAAKQGEDGAVVVFDGIVRNNSRGRRTLYLDYEAYEEMATKQMNELAREAITRFGIRHVSIVHRLGRLHVGETSVLIIVASAHRAQAYEASRWLIDTLKKTVPIWKKETFVDGAVWADGEPFPPGYAVEGADGPSS
ncbi:molybdenum cofactor biosynthesis protein MoaE [Telmatobacter sp. DSM 110680]|uniref:Molybdopterin synthase catalytic subunit n=1 Tax=Telmatobacter sp. DSM 110680 TaxID=3036704 RepID=A0AAU7DHX4_9BACT